LFVAGSEKEEVLPFQNIVFRTGPTTRIFFFPAVWLVVKVTNFFLHLNNDLLELIQNLQEELKPYQRLNQSFTIS
jgi:hypothetical protein